MDLFELGLVGLGALGGIAGTLMYHLSQIDHLNKGLDAISTISERWRSRYIAAEAEAADLRAKLDKVSAQRREAGRKGALVSNAKRSETGAAAKAKTITEMASTPMRPREAVVKGVLARRKSRIAKQSGAGVAAKTGGC